MQQIQLNSSFKEKKMMKTGNSSNKILFLFRENYKPQYKSVRDRRKLLCGWMRYPSAAVRRTKSKEKKKNWREFAERFL